VRVVDVSRERAGSVADGGFQINPAMVSSISSNMAGLTSHGTGVIGELESLVLDASAFATIGSAVAGSNASLQTQLPNVLKALMQLLGQINQHVQSANNGYQTADTAVAQSFGGNTTPATTPATQPATPAAQPAAPAPVHLNSQVVDSIMRSEGASGEQGGVPEAYGFRQNMHNGYDQIMAARAQYGQGSPEEHAVVTQLLEQKAAAAGALNFTDPGEQAAIMSAAHMRGVGGARAILNSMVSGDVQQSAQLDPNAVTSLQQLSPTDFQQQFHDARITYDQTIYGNTTTHQGGVTANWWDRYGNGLVSRYDREQQQFQNLSNGN
jgi:uncharacterized protein YukE